ncbi:hypothetical protein [Microlunatus soli]|uniref:DUF4386 domain-containing protein n=1 Tax=Microlunatus soli TaxID=630515 RepID=A0A1H1U900_9ACTN|nr:hypothetical protein [Microlunatus soli]SDS68863.1 hypothetical protein SAMN04489812_2686 [Microlunatus soli]
MTPPRDSRRSPRSDRAGSVQLITGICSIVFTIGTVLQNFVIINRRAVEQMMVLAGQSAEAASAAAPGFLTGFRIVGCVYILGNAIGILALRRRNATWLFWVVLAVNLTQAAGVVMIPPEVFRASIALYGPAGILPSVITDGGALLVTVLLVIVLIRHRRPWGPARTGTAERQRQHWRDPG